VAIVLSSEQFSQATLLSCVIRVAQGAVNLSQN